MMSTQTIASGLHTAAGGAKERRGFFKRVFDAAIAARQAAAARQVASYLANQSDARLKDLGLTDAQIGELRESRRIPVSYWS
jgi:uncharacterized protein YjiS (DUF1127 family)